jgi:hypothetical protein
MAVSYPDVIGNFLTTTERFATNGVHFAGYYEPDPMAPGQVTNLFVFIQSTTNVPVKVQFEIEVPKSGGFFSAKKPLLLVDTNQINLNLSPAEVGLLTLPVTTTEHVKTGTHPLTVIAKTAPQGRGQRIRPKKSTTTLDNVLIDSLVGLDLVGCLNATYVEKNVKKPQFPLTVTGAPKVMERAPRLQYKYDKIWAQEDYQNFNSAIQEINSRQVKLKNELTVEKLYVNLYGESVARFADCGIPMRIGEAITMAKILTYTAQYFLTSRKRSSGLLVPIWERAYAEGLDTTDALDVIRSVGFPHIVKLATAVSFGVIARASGKQNWSLEERQAVANHIAESIELGQHLDLEFMYLPLLIAGTQISKNVRMQGEDVDNSLALMQAARKARQLLFADDDMTRADKIYNRILTKALA